MRLCKFHAKYDESAAEGISAVVSCGFPQLNLEMKRNVVFLVVIDKNSSLNSSLVKLRPKIVSNEKNCEEFTRSRTIAQ